MTRLFGRQDKITDAGEMLTLVRDQLSVSTGSAHVPVTLDSTIEDIFDISPLQVLSTDTAIARGDLVYADSTPKLARLVIGTTGQFLRSDGTDPSWQTIIATDLPAHVLATTGGLGAQHTTSGLTAGQVLRAATATSAAFASLQAGDLPIHVHSGPTQGGSLTVGTTDTDATQGSVFFAGVNGVVQQDATNFFWDTATFELGIRNNTPDATLHVGDGSGAEAIIIDGGGGADRLLHFQSGGLNRWIAYTTATAESGSNVGSDFIIARYDDAGAHLASAIHITRSTGGVAIGNLGAGFVRSSAGGLLSSSALIAGDLPDNGANPSASVGLTAVNGTATTWLRSDGAPALDQGIAPTWTAAHIFQNTVDFAQYLRHDGDTDTYINFQADRITLRAGAVDMIDIVEAATDYVKINDILFVNETANAQMTTGLSINQGAADDEALAIKSSDIAHGVTTYAETDTYALMKKTVAATGGLSAWGFSENVTALDLAGWYTNADVNKTTSGLGAVQVRGLEKSGAGLGNATANANIFLVSSYVGGAARTLFLVDEDGELFADGGIASTNMVTLFDEFDDAQLVRALDLAREGKGRIASQWDEFLQYNEDHLVELGIIGAPISEGGLINITQLQRLHNGAIWQLYTRAMAQEAELKLLHKKLDLLEDGRGISARTN